MFGRSRSGQKKKHRLQDGASQIQMQKQIKGLIGLLNEFKKFILRGNVIDLAVGVIIGGAFNKIVTSLVNDLIMPVLSVFTGAIQFDQWFIALDGQHYDSLEAAGSAAVIKLGAFLAAVLDFLIMAFIIFLMVKAINKLMDSTIRADKKEPAPPPAPTTKKCPFCLQEINIAASRCPFCTSELAEAEG